jgi:hypothetical protein
LSKKTLAVTPDADLFAKVIPITIDSIAEEPVEGTVYTALAEAPADVFTLGTVNLLKSLAIVIPFNIYTIYNIILKQLLAQLQKVV